MKPETHVAVATASAKRIAVTLSLLLSVAWSGGGVAQVPLQALGAPPVPAENPLTPAKIALGKALFWEEQLSITGTVACGSCHRPVSGGSDPRNHLAAQASRNAGHDGAFGTADDVQGSPGVAAHSGNGNYVPSADFGFAPQVGGLRSPSAVNAAYSPLLFWDGRAGREFKDPATGAVLIPDGGALENQALGPPVNAMEMAPAGATLAGIGDRLAGVRPLALASDIPAALRAWIRGRDYPALFAEAFGTPELSAPRIAMAIASYERTLVSTQTPLDRELAGTPSLTPLERQGLGVFLLSDCAACHGGGLLSDNDFHNIGVRPASEDVGRFAETDDSTDLGAFRTPSLRNAELRAPYMHNGRFASLEEVVEFYDRGGDFEAPNKDHRMRPLNLSESQKAALVAFMRRPLTDPRVAAELSPFDRPTLYSESGRAPVIVGAGVPGSNDIVPLIGALEPPLLGNSNFTVTVSRARPGATATLVVGRSDPGIQRAVPVGDFAEIATVLRGAGSGGGHASVQLDLGDDPRLIGKDLYGRFYIADPQAADGFAITQAFRITVFGAHALGGERQSRNRK